MNIIMQTAFIEKISPIIQQYENDKKQITDNSVDEEMRRILQRYTNLIDVEISAAMIAIYKLFSPEALSVIVSNLTDTLDEAQRRIILSELLEEYEIIPKQKYEVIDDEVGEILEETEKEEIKYIPIIADEYEERVKTGTFDALKIGAGIAAIFTLLIEWGDMALNKAEFIAVNSTGDLFNDLSRTRQTNVGIEEFEWLTQNDNKVRETHAALHGMIFRWDTGATGVGVPPEMEGFYPKKDYNCRCFARSVIN